MCACSHPELRLVTGKPCSFVPPLAVKASLSRGCGRKKSPVEKKNLDLGGKMGRGRFVEAVTRQLMDVCPAEARFLL